MSGRTPELEEMLLRISEQARRSTWSALAGRIVKVGVAPDVDVQLIPADFSDDDQAAVLPVLRDVRLCQIALGGATITLPAKVGDRVTVLFMSRSIGRYRATGAEGDPQSLEASALSSAIVLPFDLSPDADAVASDGTNLVLEPPAAAKILLGDTATEAVALADTLKSEVNALWTLLKTHIHEGVTVGPGVTAGSPTLVGAGLTDAIKATKVNAE